MMSRCCCRVRPSLTELCGIGVLNVGKILARVDSIDRFRSPAAFATYTDTAPMKHSPVTLSVTRSRGPETGN